MAGLNPQQFHGTVADLHPGDKVLPRGAVPRSERPPSNFPGFKTAGGTKSTDAVAFSTSSEDRAWDFATSAHVTSAYEAARSGTPARSAVMRVHPHPEQERGDFHEEALFKKWGRAQAGEIPGEMIAPHFDVAERVDTKPGHQGTFPSLNWNQFAKPDLAKRWGDPANHPTDTNISQGHEGGEMNKAHLKSTFGDWEALESPYEPDDPEQGRLFK